MDKGNGVFNQANGGLGSTEGMECGTLDQMKSDSNSKKAAVHSEMARVNNLPSNSNYGVHRMKVLNKILHLLSIPRTISQEEELELLIAGLSL